MITKDNLKNVFDLINKSELNTAMIDNKDYISLWLSTFNAGCVVNVNANHWSEGLANDHYNDGQIFCDKDDFLRLFIESGSTNPAFEGWVNAKY